jgi:hypothetical protein
VLYSYCTCYSVRKFSGVDVIATLLSEMRAGGKRNAGVGSCSRQFSWKDEVLMLTTVNCYQGRLPQRSQALTILRNVSKFDTY